MTSFSESAQISTMFKKNDRSPQDGLMAYAKEAWVMIPDPQSAGTNQMSWSTSVVQSWFAFSEVVAFWNLEISPATGSYTDLALASTNNRIAMKSSIEDLVSGQYFAANGVQLTNTSRSEEAIRSRLDTLVSWDSSRYDRMGPTYQMGLDNAFGTTVAVNTGFAKRRQFLLEQATLVGGKIIVPVTYPMHMSGDLGAKLCSPMKMVNYDIRLTLAGSNGSLYQALAYDPSAPGLTLAPKFTISGQAQLWVKTVEFEPAMLSKITEKMISGDLTRRIHFTTPIVTQLRTNVTDTSIDVTLPINYTRPTRLWVFGTTTGAFNSATQSNTFACSFTQCNVMFNGRRVFANRILERPDQVYAQLLRETPGLGVSNLTAPVLSYSDYLLGYRIFCIDLDRQLAEESDPLAPIQLQFQANVAYSATASTVTAGYDVFAVVECERIVDFDMTSAGTKVIVGHA